MRKEVREREREQEVEMRREARERERLSREDMREVAKQEREMRKIMLEVRPAYIYDSIFINLAIDGRKLLATDW